ncbi:dipeptidyl aminopeptidase/acylaminoacyl-peptidase related protein [Sphingobium chlorophenolicum L-1]|uniref:Dipeptidyl aminopeptidase/acylaminoacyl-peptidase related protein n=1 Tax=Sphingobium chlorophenolicum L-1 TaxID=690566 RepID=F6F2K8_SPHCR|nr:alpha/beta fold hydrolase [Sphingobium chlorophenolicum]AEG50670.1 dipeptidyl aminopeptidase/acylaminoacyl-peptidase related protein [Sphingobium chlorophenolicum L-1]
MAAPVIESADDPRKFVEALQRAVTMTRMVDYGVPLGDAVRVRTATLEEPFPSWPDACEHLANRHAHIAGEAEAAGRLLTARYAWRASAALLMCGQLAFNFDEPRKLELYEGTRQALLRYAALDERFSELVIPTKDGDLYGWVVRPSDPEPQAAVIVIGGLSGWGAGFLDMARALADRGILAILAEGPGQGLTRMRSGIAMNIDALSHFGAFLDHAEAAGARHLGIWGNSWGGLIAAQVAARDPRIQAACINGAPMLAALPEQRTAREQLFAFYGTTDEAELRATLEAFTMDPARQHIAGSLLVLEGGNDPLVPLGAQHAFTALTDAGKSRIVTWADGEHTIYNHAQERSALAADWFAEQLAVPAQ